MKYELWVGLATSKPENLNKLLTSFINNNIEELPIIKKLNFIIYVNAEEQSLFHDLSAVKNLNCLLIPNQEIKSKPFQKFSIAQTRQIIHQNLFKRIHKKCNVVAWIIDDDTEIDHRVAHYLNSMPIFFENNIDVVISPCDGESANCFYAGLRVQLFDIYENYKWLKSLPPNDILPDKSKDNFKFRRQYPEYYYDLTQLHSAHLKIPYWLEPEFESETVTQAITRLLANANQLLNGRTVSRKLIHDVPDNLLQHAKPSINAGGNVFVLNATALLTPNITITLENRSVRRSDMIWLLMNISMHQMNIVSTNLPIIHLGSNEGQISQEKMIDELIGASFVHALKEIVGDNHSWCFSNQEKKKLEKLFIAKLKHRNNLFSENVIYIKQLIKKMQSHPQLRTFGTKCLIAFDEKMNNIVLEVNKFISKDIDLELLYKNISNQVTKNV